MTDEPKPGFDFFKEVRDGARESLDDLKSDFHNAAHGVRHGVNFVRHRARKAYKVGEEKFGKDRMLGLAFGAHKGALISRVFPHPAVKAATIVAGAAAGFALARPVMTLSWKLSDWLDAQHVHESNENTPPAAEEKPPRKPAAYRIDGSG